MPTKAPLPMKQPLHSIEAQLEAKAIRIELEELYGVSKSFFELNGPLLTGGSGTELNR